MADRRGKCGSRGSRSSRYFQVLSFQVVYIYIHWNITQLKKEWNNAICSNIMDLEIIILSEVNQTKTSIIWHHLYVETKKWYKLIYLQIKNRLTDIENKQTWLIEEKSESESCSVISNSLWPHKLYNPWNSPDQNTRVGSHSLLQGIFPTQGLNPGLMHCMWILYPLSY